MTGVYFGEFPKLQGHNNNVNCLTFSPNHKLLASCSLDETIIIWNVIECREIKKFTGHKGSVNCVVFD